MKAPVIGSHAFVLSARQGRTREPLQVFDTPVLVKLAGADTEDRAATFHITVPPLSGPPLHRHSREDEWFYVLEGEIAIEFLASPEDLSDTFCLIRGTMPPGVVVPLHSHAEPELLYVLDGSIEVYRSNHAGNEWASAIAGDAVAIPGSVKHALRNSTAANATLALFTKSKLYAFFRELAQPLDPCQPAPPATENLRELSEAAARYGYWLASPQENAAIGISIGECLSEGDRSAL